MAWYNLYPLSLHRLIVAYISASAISIEGGLADISVGDTHWGG